MYDGGRHPGTDQPADLLIVADERTLGADEQPDPAGERQQDRQQEQHEGPAAGRPCRRNLLV
ncbi:MAG TPA: hypothetical protein VJZ71_20180 [Phycisphaerae bacterium]|nr:hypothetical protein [Phycisphaerae bacterium]